MEKYLELVASEEFDEMNIVKKEIEYWKRKEE